MIKLYWIAVSASRFEGQHLWQTAVNTNALARRIGFQEQFPYLLGRVIFDKSTEAVIQIPATRARWTLVPLILIIVSARQRSRQAYHT